MGRWSAVVAAMVLVASLLVGCGLMPSPQEPADAAAARQEFDEYLIGYGQRFDPGPTPAEAADWQPAVQGFQSKTMNVSRAVFGTVTCVDPAKDCADRGLVRPGQQLAIWLITFTGTAAACSAWATVDATTGAFINGRGWPC